jgi:hypothetical protein
MTKYDRLSHILQVYLEGELEEDTAVAELTHVYLDRGWRFTLVEADCAPMYRNRMRILSARVEAAMREPPTRAARAVGGGTRRQRRRQRPE